VTRSLAAYYSEFAIASPLLLQHSPMLLIAASTEMRGAPRVPGLGPESVWALSGDDLARAGAIWDATRGSLRETA